MFVSVIFPATKLYGCPLRTKVLWNPIVLSSGSLEPIFLFFRTFFFIQITPEWLIQNVIFFDMDFWLTSIAYRSYWSKSLISRGLRGPKFSSIFVYPPYSLFTDLLLKWYYFCIIFSFDTLDRVVKIEKISILMHHGNYKLCTRQ